MPIFKYFALAGTALIALIYLADAHLPKGTSAVATSQSYGLPQPWKPEPAPVVAALTDSELPVIETTGSSATREAEVAPHETKPLKVATNSARVDVTPSRSTKKIKVASKRKPTVHQQRYASQRETAPDSFGGLFGRF